MSNFEAKINLQNGMKYFNQDKELVIDELLHSEWLIKLAKFLVEGKAKINFTGTAWSNLKGNFIIFETELELEKLRKQFSLPNSIRTHIWRDIKSGYEKGFIDIETQEGVLGTIVRDENPIVKKDWNYILTEIKGKYFLDVICGSVGLYMIKIELDKEEMKMYDENGLEFIEDLASKITYLPNLFINRSIITDETKFDNNEI